MGGGHGDGAEWHRVHVWVRGGGERHKEPGGQQSRTCCSLRAQRCAGAAVAPCIAPHGGSACRPAAGRRDLELCLCPELADRQAAAWPPCTPLRSHVLPPLNAALDVQQVLRAHICTGRAGSATICWRPPSQADTPRLRPPGCPLASPGRPRTLPPTHTAYWVPPLPPSELADACRTVDFEQHYYF